MTDERDRRCLLTILLDFYCPALITETKYKLPTNPNYFIPPKMEYHEYIEFIKVSDRVAKSTLSLKMLRETIIMASNTPW